MEFQKYITKNSFLYNIIARILGLFFLVFNKSRGNNLTNNQNVIFVISLHRIGDTIFTFPAIRYLRKLYGNAITIICFEHGAMLYKLLDPRLKFIILNKQDFFFENRISKISARRKINILKPNIVFDLTGTINAVSLLLFLKKCEIIGCTDPLLMKFYTKSKIFRVKPHLIDMYFDTVKLKHPEAKMVDENEYQLNYNEEDDILIHPFAGWKAKEWNLEKFILLAEKLAKNYNVKIIFESGQTNHPSLKRMIQKGVGIIKTNNFEELLEAIKNSSLMIGNDSGPVYIANFLGKPTFTIYGPTNPSFSIPFGKSHRFISKKINCSPVNEQYCFTHGGLYCPNYECMNQLELEDVFSSLELFLNELKIKKSETIY